MSTVSVVSTGIEHEFDAGVLDDTSDPYLPSVLDLLNSAPSRHIHQRDSVSPAEASPPVSSSNNEESPLSDCDDDARLNIARFAYVNAPKSSRASSKGTLSRSGSIASVKNPGCPPKKIARLAGRSLTADFSENDLAKLLKCVSCDLAWTTRKTVVQKLKHIQLCAKKKSLTDSTITILIRKELENASSDTAAGKGKGKCTSPVDEEQQDPGTLLEDVLNDNGTRKKGKRHQAVTTLKSLTQTREAILDKARRLISDVPAEVDGMAKQDIFGGEDNRIARVATVEMPPPTQAFGTSVLAKHHSRSSGHAQSVAFPPTQAFAPSRFVTDERVLTVGLVATEDVAISRLDHGLASICPSHTEAAQTTLTSPDPDVPLSTQLFAPSRLHGATVDERFPVAVGMMVKPAASSSKDDVPMLPSTIKDITRSNNMCALSVTRRSSTSTASYDHHMSQSVLHAQADHVQEMRSEYDWHSNNWINDDVYLHFDADEDPEQFIDPVSKDLEDTNCTATFVPPREPHLLELEAERGQGRTPEVPKSAVSINDNSRMTIASVPQMNSVKPRAKKSRSKKAQDREAQSNGPEEQGISESDFNLKLKEAILKDNALHLRILRYEPVQFDVFVQLAVDLDLQNRGLGQLKGRVRDFLDKQAIHFYGENVSGSRTRRRP
ncbi:hypothetical protein AcV5_001091 [Taiwanofungus camphoratus]|nr:hypothetical protein AcV7_003494 [Antrodia cinnamomea]KAI0939799.1 hypothetical protein AcV5_001091 [Antrodia cinnamomea]